jgi:hypothetical protein
VVFFLVVSRRVSLVRLCLRSETEQYLLRRAIFLPKTIFLGYFLSIFRIIPILISLF